MTKFIHQPVKLSAAASFVAKHHRHSKPLKRHKFSIGAWEMEGAAQYEAQEGHTDFMLGVVTVDNCSSGGWSKMHNFVELRRVCIHKDAPKNTASFLISRARDACFAMGYDYVVTYTRPTESGSSLAACGFLLVSVSQINFDNSGRLTWMASKDNFASVADHFLKHPGGADELRQWSASRRAKVKAIVQANTEGI